MIIIFSPKQFMLPFNPSNENTPAQFIQGYYPQYDAPPTATTHSDIEFLKTQVNDLTSEVREMKIIMT